MRASSSGSGSPGSVRDAVAFHAAFGVLALAGLALPAPALGWRLLALVVIYNVAFFLVGRWRMHREWTRLWAFLVPLSAFQVIPDAVLVGVIGSLDFPDTGGPRLGPIPLAMAGMWTIPLWVALFAADRQRAGDRVRILVAGLFTGLILVGAEATLWAIPIWQAVGVTTVAHVALYVVLPEVLLGSVAYAAYLSTRDGSRGRQVAAAALVSLVYAGALVTSYGIIERGLFP
ncbi:MAG: hypothetical protein AAGK21_07505 [Bacteroidota bacterium]